MNPEGRCPQPGTFVPLTLGPAGPNVLRVTYRDPVAGTLLCDGVISTEDPRNARLGVPRQMGGDGGSGLRADVVVEAWRTLEGSEPMLLGSGEALDVDLAAGGEARILITPRESFACAPDHLEVPRAFHTATALPSGEVLVLGGITAETPGEIAIDLVAPPGGGFFPTATAEIYDPTTGQLEAVDVPDLTPRAFHQVYLLGDPIAGAPRRGPFELLVVGGLTGDSTILDGVRDASEPLRLVPSSSATAASAQIITYDPATRTASVRPVNEPAYEPRLFGAATPPPSRWDPIAQTPPVIAGGWMTFPGALAPSFQVVDPMTGAPLGGPVTLTPGILRAGASVTHLGNERALVFGGNLSSVMGAESNESAHLLAGIASMPSVLPVTISATSPPPPRAFHTAVALGDGRVLVVGGFAVGAGEAIDPADPAAFIVTVTDVQVGDPPVTQHDVSAAAVGGDPIVPVGYLDVAPLISGGFLITGGSPNRMFACPGEPGATYLCALPAAYRFVGSNVENAGELIMPRWGHRSALLSDGTVLVTGGLRYDDGLVLVEDVELWNPRTEALDPVANDPAIFSGQIVRAPADVARFPLDMTPARPCAVVE